MLLQLATKVTAGFVVIEGVTRVSLEWFGFLLGWLVFGRFTVRLF